ncbi:MAG: hypothetical protein GY795_30945 [Desulfobacterales bacterium]|nr:hypothetical protein [Desulfobacterales bacterium]
MNKSIIFLIFSLAGISAYAETIVVEENSPAIQKEILEYDQEHHTDGAN